MKFKVALIGFGYWGPKLARNIQNSNFFQIEYIVDKSKKNIDNEKKAFPLSKVISDYKKINNQKIDLVVISTPTKTHFQMASFFLKYTNVLVEKPLSLSIRQVNKLENLAKKLKNKLFVDYPFIFTGWIKMIKSKKEKKNMENS